MLLRDSDLILQLVRRDVIGRYRGSVLGIIWSLLTPLFMLAVYSFVFGTVFKPRWTASTSEAGATTGFGIILFAGLIVFQLFAEVINKAPSLVLANANYVKKVVFPLEVLVPVALGSALFHGGVSLLVLLGFKLFADGTIPLTALWLPVVLAPYCLLILGFGWLLASLGVYFRDLGQFLGTLVTALMFMSPIFFPVTALPEWLRPWVALNPIAYPVEEARNVLLFARSPDPLVLAVYSGIALLVAAAGYQWFQRTRRGFADVL